MNSGKQAAVNDVISATVNDGLLVSLVRVGLFGRNEGRTDVAHIGTHRLRGEH